MDDGDFTTTKSVENVFGNLVRKLKKAGSKGFSKATDDLVIKESGDLINPELYEWRAKAIRNAKKQIKRLEKEFNERQKKLIVEPQ